MVKYIFPKKQGNLSLPSPQQFILPSPIPTNGDGKKKKIMKIKAVISNKAKIIKNM